MRRMRAASEVKRGDLEAAPVRDEEGNVIGCERVGFLLTVGVVAECTYPCDIRHQCELTEVVVGIGSGRSIV